MISPLDLIRHEGDDGKDGFLGAQHDFWHSRNVLALVSATANALDGGEGLEADWDGDGGVDRHGLSLWFWDWCLLLAMFERREAYKLCTVGPSFQLLFGYGRCLL